MVKIGKVCAKRAETAPRSVYADDLANHTSEYAVRVEFLPHGLETRDMLRGVSILSPQQLRRITYARVKILRSVFEHIPRVLGPVWPARELINDGLGEVWV